MDPNVAHGWLVETERRPGPAGAGIAGAISERALTVFLAGAECPFTCTFCDLWRWSIDGPTPPGALPRQLAAVLRAAAATGAHAERVKLYNASNFFDRRAVPLADRPEIAALCAPFGAVTVESHASTIGAETLAFARLLTGRLEVAVGLETIHPEAAARLNKRLALPRFDRAARFLTEAGVDLRVFVLLGAPHIPVGESVAWTVRTVEYAAERGAAAVSIIPVRGGNGEMQRLQALGAFTPPTLAQLEEALDRCITFTPAAVAADLWDAAQLPGCEQCRAARIERLRRMNVTGSVEARVACSMCGLE